MSALASVSTRSRAALTLGPGHLLGRLGQLVVGLATVLGQQRGVDRRADGVEAVAHAAVGGEKGAPTLDGATDGQPRLGPLAQPAIQQLGDRGEQQGPVVHGQHQQADEHGQHRHAALASRRLPQGLFDRRGHARALDEIDGEGDSGVVHWRLRRRQLHAGVVAHRRCSPSRRARKSALEWGAPST